MIWGLVIAAQTKNTSIDEGKETNPQIILENLVNWRVNIHICLYFEKHRFNARKNSLNEG